MEKTTPPIQNIDKNGLADLRLCKKELIKEIEKREFEKKKNGIEYDTKQAIDLLYTEIDDVNEHIRNVQNNIL